MKNRAVGYVRVSTDIQAKEGHSIDAQKQAIFNYCTYKNLEFSRFYDRDAGKSGANMKRDDLQLMLSELERGTVVIVVSISRLSRSIKDTQEIIETINNKGCSLVILDLDVDTTKPTGQLMLNVMSALSEFERKQTADRVSTTMNNMSREGKLITKPRFGYKVVKEGKISRVEEHPEEQLIIDKIRNYIREDPKITISAIARNLNSDNVTIRKAKCVYPHFVKKVIADNKLRT